MTLRKILIVPILMLIPAVAAADSSNGQVTVGSARFTVITPQCIRLEFSSSGHFVDEPSYFAANRTARFENAKIASDATSATIDTGVIKLNYKANGQPFSGDNLQAVITTDRSTIDWHAGQANTTNLGGTERTLDGWDGARQLSDGLLSRDGWYVLDDSKSPLFTSDWVKSRPADAGSDLYLFGYGNDFKSALRSLTAISGPVPMPRRYTLGVWYSRYWPYSSSDYRKIVQEYADHGFPLDAIVMDMDWHKDGWTGYTWNPKLLSDHQELLNWFHKQGLAVTLNDHPADGVGPQEEMYAPFMRAMGKDPAKDKPLKFDAGDKKYLDTFYEFTHRPLEKEGVDFWWLDWQQYPFTRSVQGLTNLEWLNYYNYNETSRDDKRGVSFSRWGGWGSQRYPIQFSGDASTSFKMLAFEVPFTATAGNVGCFFWSHDIGGHNRGRNEESYARWCQFGAFSAALRSHSTRDATMDRRPWTYANWAEESMQKSFQLRSRFFPYIYTAVQQACVNSLPFIRPMYLDNPTEEAAYHQPQEYLFGDNLLVAPIAESGAGANRLGRQSVWFPRGTWFNFFTSEKFEGNTQALVAGDIDEFPLFVRAGMPIPMRSFTQRMATDPLNELVIRAYPGTDGQSASSTLYEDDGTTTAYRSSAAAAAAQTKLTYSRASNDITVTIDPVDGKFPGQVQERAYVIELPALKPATKVLIDGASASAEYVQAESMNRIHVPSRSVHKGCVITVSAEEIAPEIFRTRAFAHRTGITSPDAGASMTALLTRALDQATTDPERSAICAAAGIGIFPRIENPNGYPAVSVDEKFSPGDVTAELQPTTAPGAELAAKQAHGFQVTIGGKTYSAGSGNSPVDWAAKPGNIAAKAHITLSSGGPARGLVDGLVDGYPGPREAEWTTNRETTGAWAKFEWRNPEAIDRVVLFDRPNMNDQVLAGHIEFSDGVNVPFGKLDNGAANGTEIKFPARTVKWIKIVISETAKTTENVGLAEVAVFATKPE